MVDDDDAVGSPSPSPSPTRMGTRSTQSSGGTAASATQAQAASTHGDADEVMAESARASTTPESGVPAPHDAQGPPRSYRSPRLRAAAVRAAAARAAAAPRSASANRSSPSPSCEVSEWRRLISSLLIAHPLTHSTHSLHSLTHPPTHSLTHSFTPLHAATETQHGAPDEDSVCARALEPAAAEEKPLPSPNDDGAEADAQQASPTAMSHSRKRATPPVAAVAPSPRRFSPQKATAPVAARPLALRTAPPGGRRLTSKEAYKRVAKAKITCSAACKQHMQEHRARNKGTKDPSKGFHHLKTCPHKRAADAWR